MTMHTDPGYYTACITTRYIGATNNRPARIVAQHYGLRLTRAYDHALGPVDNHTAVAFALADRLRPVGSDVPTRFAAYFLTDDKRGYGFVLLPFNPEV